MRFLPPFLVDANDPLEVAMARESLRLRASQSINARKTVIVAALIAGLSFSLLVPWWRIAWWAVPVMLMAQVNAVVCARILTRTGNATPEELAEFQGRLWWMTAINQVLMGLTVWWIGYGKGGSVATIATTLQLIYVGGALVNASTHPPTLVSGAWINLMLAAAFWLVEGGQNGLPLVAALLGIGLVVSASCEKTALAFRESLRMRFENASLLRQLEEEKRVAVEANMAKSRFLAAASHDLRQPLHALLVFSSLLHRHETPQTTQLISHIRNAAGSLDKLFAGLLDISKLETGSVVPQIQVVNVTAMAQDLTREFASICEGKGISLEVRGDPVWALSDAFLLERILRNLLDNGIKYTVQGSVVIEVAASLSTVEIRVKDTGIGIAADVQERIFEEYFQVGNPSRDPIKGSGLGLAIVRRLVSLLHARMSMTSQPDVGTTFCLALPQAPIFDESGTGVMSPAPVVESLQGVEVWLVEDNEMVRVATMQALETWGCRITHWPGMPPEEAIEGASVAPLALIADFRLADAATGLQVAARLRQRWPELPVAIVTGDPSIDSKEVERLGNVVMMQKPVLPAVMIGWLSGVDRRSRSTGSPAEPVRLS